MIGRTKLGLTTKEVGRLTLREFNNQYQLYKDNFDLELVMSIKHITYKALKEKQQANDEWL